MGRTPDCWRGACIGYRIRFTVFKLFHECLLMSSECHTHLPFFGSIEFPPLIVSLSFVLLSLIVFAWKDGIIWSLDPPWLIRQDGRMVFAHLAAGRISISGLLVLKTAA